MKNPEGIPRGLWPYIFFLLLLLMVMFSAVNLARFLVLFVIDLLTLLRRQLATIGLLIGPNLPVDFRFVPFQSGGLTGG